MITPSSGRKRRRTKSQNVNVKKMKSLTKPGTKSIKRQLLGLMENKRFVASVSFPAVASSMSGDTFYGSNLLYWIQTGSSDSQKIGDEIFLNKLTLTLKVNLIRNTTRNGANVWFGVVKSNREISAGSLGFSYTSTSMDYRLSGTNSTVSNPILDYNECSLIAFTTGKIEQANNTTGTLTSGTGTFSSNNFTPLDLRLDIDMKDIKYTYKSGNVGYGKFYNYYVVWGVAEGGSGTASLYDGSLSALVQFKDS